MTHKIIEALSKITSTLPPVLAAGTLVFIAHMYFEAEIWSLLDVAPSCDPGDAACIDVYSQLTTRVVSMLETRGDNLLYLLFFVVGAAIATAPWRGRAKSHGG